MHAHLFSYMHTFLNNQHVTSPLSPHSVSRSSSKEASVKKAFDTIDEDKDGKVTIGDLKHILTKIGDKLSEEEVNKALSDANFNPANVNEELNLEAFLRITGLSK